MAKKCGHRLGVVNGWCIQCGQPLHKPQEHYDIDKRRLLRNSEVLPTLSGGFIKISQDEINFIEWKRRD